MPNDFPPLTRLLLDATHQAERLIECAAGFGEANDSERRERYRDGGADFAVLLTRTLAEAAPLVDQAEPTLERRLADKGHVGGFACGTMEASTGHGLGWDRCKGIATAAWFGVGHFGTLAELDARGLPTKADYLENWERIAPIVQRHAEGFNASRLAAIVKSEAVLLGDRPAATKEKTQAGSVDRAIALLVGDQGRWLGKSIASVAKSVGCHTATLTRSKRFKAFWDRLHQVEFRGKPRGYKNAQTRELEAFDDEG